jgi:hypothetical protein
MTDASGLPVAAGAWDVLTKVHIVSTEGEATVCCTALSLTEGEERELQEATTTPRDSSGYDLIDVWLGRALGVRGRRSRIIFGAQDQDRFQDSLNLLIDSAAELVLKADLDTSLVRPLVAALIDTPVAEFGRPPDSFQNLAQLLTKPGAMLVASGTASGLSHDPVLVVASTAGVFVYWFAKPLAQLARRSLASRLASTLNTQLTDEDLN